MHVARRTISVAALLALGGLILANRAAGATVTLRPAKDTTIYGNGDAKLSNGARLVAFDLAGQIPVGATINSVSVSLANTTPGGGEARLSNLSVRAALAAGQNLIVGFSVSGGTRSILMRGVGPTLTNFGLAGTMADPRFELFNGTTLVAENDDWGAARRSARSSRVCGRLRSSRAGTMRRCLATSPARAP